MKAIAALKEFASPVMKDYDSSKNEKDLMKAHVMGEVSKNENGVGAGDTTLPITPFYPKSFGDDKPS